MYNYNNIEFDYLRLVNKQIYGTYGTKKQDIEKKHTKHFTIFKPR